jgi:signal transduction histidine kinase
MPAMLEDLGLLKTIRFFCQQQSEYYQHAKIIIDLNVDEENIPDIFKTTIFRVIQEALNNAFKHGEANSIQLSLIETGDSIELCVTDNGRGFDPENLTSNSDLLSGFGLKGMHHRAVVCNGTCKISSQIGKGTKVKLSLPYH